jgi:hypothetical protein
MFTKEFLPREGIVEIPVFFVENAQTDEYESHILNDLALAEREGVLEPTS